MRKFAVPMLLLGGLLLSATAFTATQQTRRAATASTTRHEMTEAKAKEMWSPMTCRKPGSSNMRPCMKCSKG
ncbi:MAG: hypothetical protein ACYCZI_12710 [Metallibacterium scheffleri]